MASSLARPRRGALITAFVGLALGFALGWQAREFAAKIDCREAGGIWMERAAFCGVAEEAP